MTSVSSVAEGMSALKISENLDQSLFLKVISIPEILSKILRDLEERARLNLRACCHATEEAVAHSDMHIPPQRWRVEMQVDGDNKPRNWSCSASLRKYSPIMAVHFGKYRLTGEKTNLDQLVRIRKRCCARIYVSHVMIEAVDFNTQTTFIKDLLDRCVFRVLRVIIRPEEYHPSVIELLRQYESQELRLTFLGMLLDTDTLLSLRPRLSFGFFDPDHGDAKESYPEEVLIQMVKRNHRMLEIPVEISSGKVVLDVLEIVESRDDQQCVEFNLNSDHLDEFLELIGFSCTETTIDQRGESEFALVDEETRVDDDDEDEYEKILWFTLQHGKKGEIDVQKNVRRCTVTIKRGIDGKIE